MQKQLIAPVVAVVLLLMLGWRMISLERNVAELQQKLARSDSLLITPPVQTPASSDVGGALSSTSISPAFTAKPSPSAASIPVRADPAKTEQTFQDRIAELEEAVTEIGEAWNAFADAEEQKRLQAQKPAWSPAQAVGAPDTAAAGDLPTAWASRDPDGGMEWLQTRFARPVEVAQVRVRETYNPGAVVKITGHTPAGAEVVLWQGNEPVMPAPADQVFNVPAGIVVGSVRVHLDTSKIPGWNEIDAIELIGRDGTRQWASDATASSTYANMTASQ